MMNFFDNTGKLYPFEKIEEMTSRQGISIRTGCFCNPGIDEINNCITTEEISKYFVGREEGNYHEMNAFLGKMRGSVRVSCGIATVKKDLDKFIAFIRSLRDQPCVQKVKA